MKKLKKLEDLHFETEADERKYLLKRVFDDACKEDEDFTIGDLREMYVEIQRTQDLNEKYQKTSIYWSEEQEKAIVDYLKSTNEHEKNRIFERKLYKPFGKLVENIIFTYKLYRSDIEAKDLEIDCLSFLITKIEKFNPNSGTRAFAYFGTIAKHYLMGEKKLLYKQTLSVYDVGDSQKEINKNEEYVFNPDSENQQDKNITVFEKIILVLDEELDNPKMPDSDKAVAEAIIYIFTNHEMLDVYNRNLVYHLLKERTGLHGKEITYSLGRLKKFYKIFKEEFLKEKE
jgi:hypothetical protein